MTQNRILEWLLRFKTDEAAQRRVLRSTADIERNIEAITGSLGDMNPKTRAAVSALIERFEALGVRIEDRQDEVRALVAELNRLDDVQVKPKVTVEQGRQAIGDFSSTFGAAASVTGAQSLAGAGDLLGLVEYIPLAVQGLSALNPVMLGLTAITGGLLLGISALNAEHERQREEVEATTAALQKEADARRSLLSAISAADPGAIGVRMEELRAEINTIRQEELNPLLNQRNNLIADAFAAQANIPQFDNVDELKRQEMAERAVDTSAVGQALNQEIETIGQALEPLTDQLADLEAFGEVGARVLQGINAPLRELEKTRELAALTGDELDARLAGATNTVTAYGLAISNADGQIEQARRDGNGVLVDALNIEKARLEAGFDAAQAELELLDTRGRLIAATNDAIEAEKRRAAALSAQTDAYFKAVENTVKAQEAVVAAAKQAREAYDKYIADGAKLAAEAQARMNDLAVEGEERRADIIEKGRDAIAKIERDAGRRLSNAVAERDALAFRQQQQQRDDALDDARKAAGEQLREQERGQEKALSSLRENIARQTAALDAGYRQQQQQLANAALRAQADLLNAKTAELSIAQYGSNGQRVIHQTMWSDLYNIGVNYAQSLVNTVGFLLNRVQSGAGGGSNRAINDQIDYRLKQYFQGAGITER